MNKTLITALIASLFIASPAFAAVNSAARWKPAWQ